MVQPEFEEKQFEGCHRQILCIDNDGTDSDAHIYPVGQYLENTLGVDAGALLPPHHPLWSVIGCGYPSGSVPLHSESSRCVNLFLQYKRATYHPPPKSMYYYHFQKDPYYGFKVSTPRGQLETLLRLSRNVEDNYRGLAVVRYVAPMFHTEDELWDSRDDRTILHRSVYVPPTKFDGSNGKHNACYYSPNPTIDAIFNPEPELNSIESYEKFMRGINNVTPTYPFESFGALAETIQYSDYKLRRRIARLIQLPFSTREFPGSGIGDVLTIAAFAYFNNLQWLIFASR